MILYGYLQLGQQLPPHSFAMIRHPLAILHQHSPHPQVQLPPVMNQVEYMRQLSSWSEHW